MADIEKVIKGLECCNAPNNHDDCPYNGENHYNVCTHKLLRDALELLKAQKSIAETYKKDLDETLEVVANRLNVVRCKECIFYKDGVCEKWGFNHPEDYFCKDGDETWESY